MATPLRVTTTYAKSTGALLRNLHVAVPASMLMAAVAATFDYLIYTGAGGGGDQHSATIQVMLGWFAVYLLIAVFIGPLFSASAVFVAKKSYDGKPAGLYGALNFALNRYKRLFVPHMAATLSVQIGLQVLIPGILFMCMYAFVDSVACLEDEKSVLSRSKRLTRKRRRTILWVALPIILLGLVKGFLIDPQALEYGPLALWASHTLSYVLEWWMALAFSWMYLIRTDSSGRTDASGKAEATTASA
jgi:hypothetical protein